MYDFESYRRDVAERQLYRGTETGALAPRTFDVLVVLVERAGSLVTKDELMRAVWGEAAVEEANVAVAVSALRRGQGIGGELFTFVRESRSTAVRSVRRSMR